MLIWWKYLEGFVCSLLLLIFPSYTLFFFHLYFQEFYFFKMRVETEGWMYQNANNHMLLNSVSVFCVLLAQVSWKNLAPIYLSSIYMCELYFSVVAYLSP